MQLQHVGSSGRKYFDELSDRKHRTFRPSTYAYFSHSYSHKQYRLNSKHVFTAAPAVCRVGTQDESIDYLRNTKGLFCHMYYLTLSLLLNASFICTNMFYLKIPHLFSFAPSLHIYIYIYKSKEQC